MGPKRQFGLRENSDYGEKNALVFAQFDRKFVRSTRIRGVYCMTNPITTNPQKESYFQVQLVSRLNRRKLITNNSVRPLGFVIMLFVGIRYTGADFIMILKSAFDWNDMQNLSRL